MGNKGTKKSPQAKLNECHEKCDKKLDKPRNYDDYRPSRYSEPRNYDNFRPRHNDCAPQIMQDDCYRPPARIQTINYDEPCGRQRSVRIDPYCPSVQNSCDPCPPRMPRRIKCQPPPYYIDIPPPPPKRVRVCQDLVVC